MPSSLLLPTAYQLNFYQCELPHAGLTLERPRFSVGSGDRFMLLKLGFYYSCEVVGRVSAIITIVGMGSLVLAATAADLIFVFEG